MSIYKVEVYLEWRSSHTTSKSLSDRAFKHTVILRLRNGNYPEIF